MEQISDEDYNHFLMSAQELVNFILNDSDNLVAIHPLSSNSILLEKTSVCQHKNDAYQRINSNLQIYWLKRNSLGIERQSTQPESVLSHFISEWKDPGNVSELFDIFVMILTPSWGWNPEDNHFYENFISKKVLKGYPMLNNFLE